MCYAIPGKIVELKDKVAVIDYFGEHRNVLNESADACIGDYVYAQGGIIIQRIPEKEALDILVHWKELFFHLKQVDYKNLRKFEAANYKSSIFARIINKVKEKHPLDRSEMLHILKTVDKEELSVIYNTANEIRHKELQNACCVHGIIEFSNYCVNDCFYCGINANNLQLKRYRMEPDEIVELAVAAVDKLGFKALVLQSGDDHYYSQDMLVEIIRRIKEKCAILLFISIGERDAGIYKAMYDAGARVALLRFETSSPELYAQLHKTSKFDNRIALLNYARDLGFLIATGGLIGLPGQTDEDILNGILLANDMKVDMYSFGPFIPHPETPLAKSALVDIDRVLKVIALTRFIDRQAKILVTTALETLDPDNGRRLGLLAGANSLMLNVTPPEYKKLYQIYPSKAGVDKNIELSIKETIDLLYSLGRAPTDLGI